jgi:hypothetical protein
VPGLQGGRPDLSMTWDPQIRIVQIFVRAPK